MVKKRERKQIAFDLEDEIERRTGSLSTGGL
jgi:hypothetical protein